MKNENIQLSDEDLEKLKILNDEYPFQVFSYPLDPNIKRKLNKADEIFSKYWAYIE